MRFNNPRFRSNNSSTFYNALIAEATIKKTLLDSQNRAKIRAWQLNPNRERNLLLYFPGDGTNLGFGIRRNNFTPQNYMAAKVLLKLRDPSNPKLGWFVNSAHPIRQIR